MKTKVTDPSLFNLLPAEETKGWSKNKNDAPYISRSSKRLTVKSIVERSKDYGLAHLDGPLYHYPAVVSAQYQDQL